MSIIDASGTMVNSKLWFTRFFQMFGVYKHAKRIRRTLLILFTAMLATTCSNQNTITDVYVQDVNLDAPKNCRVLDVDLSHVQAKEFFVRAKKTTYDSSHDNYKATVCYIAGTLEKNNNACEWGIRVNAIGYIQCGSNIQYYACNKCQHLFK